MAENGRRPISRRDRALHNHVDPAANAVEAVWKILRLRGVLCFDDLGGTLVSAATPHLRAEWEADMIARLPLSVSDLGDQKQLRRRLESWFAESKGTA